MSVHHKVTKNNPTITTVSSIDERVLEDVFNRGWRNSEKLVAHEIS